MPWHIFTLGGGSNCVRLEGSMQAYAGKKALVSHPSFAAAGSST
jgi:hypothetical protein